MPCHQDWSFSLSSGEENREEEVEFVKEQTSAAPGSSQLGERKKRKLSLVLKETTHLACMHAFIVL
jgi:hypothetical protein